MNLVLHTAEALEEKESVFFSQTRVQLCFSNWVNSSSKESGEAHVSLGYDQSTCYMFLWILLVKRSKELNLPMLQALWVLSGLNCGHLSCVTASLLTWPESNCVSVPRPVVGEIAVG